MYLQMKIPRCWFPNKLLASIYRHDSWVKQRPERDMMAPARCCLRKQLPLIGSHCDAQMPSERSSNPTTKYLATWTRVLQ